ncbi:MAG: efflux RND transporter periplasmic adaptor subunit [Candidatus Daviesbacteria bacterium]|nr:efflux RND transporter periplasmic adaptor subunit [Candidatus Daviesbacteria bacterium]
MKSIFSFLKLHKKALIALILFIILAVFISFRVGWIGSKEPVYKTITLSKGDLATVINASGQIESENEATLSFLSPGRIAFLGFKTGDNVSKGQVIASLDSTQAQLTYNKAQSAYKSAQSSLTKVLDDIHLAQYGNGGFSNVGSSNETMTQKNTRELAENAKDEAFRDLQSAAKALEFSTIIAPFDGIISDISGIYVGQNVSAASPSSVKIVGLGQLKFVANVDEIDYSKLKVGDQAEILLDAYPDEKFSGQITKIGAVATRLTTGGSVVPADLTINNTEKLKSGLNGEMNVTITSKTSVLVLPNSAIRKEGDSRYVYVLINNKVEKRNITVGETLGSQTEVIGGLNEGDAVVLGDIVK